MQRFKLWCQGHPWTVGISAMALVLAALTTAAMLKQPGIALVAAPVFAMLLQSFVQWAATSEPLPRHRRPPTDPGDA